jgi:hypothetical protein
MVSHKKGKNKPFSAQRRSYKVKSKPQAKRRSSKAAPTIVYPTIVYHAGGDSFRPFVVLPSTDPSWPLPACAFYQSSGRSNDALNGLYAGSWLPTGGLDETGHIIKLQAYSDNQLLPWALDLLETYFGGVIQDANALARSRSLRTGLMKENKPLFDEWKEIALRCQQIYQFIQYYFLLDWQLKASAEMGGGFWDRVPTFRQHVLRTINTHVPVPSSLPSSSDHGEEAAVVRAFLVEHRATMTPESKLDLTTLLGKDHEKRKLWEQLSGLIHYFTRAEVEQSRIDERLKKPI